MAHPKRRQSKTRTAKRRTHDKAVAPTLGSTMPHTSAVSVRKALQVTPASNWMP